MSKKSSWRDTTVDMANETLIKASGIVREVELGGGGGGDVPLPQADMMTRDSLVDLRLGLDAGAGGTPSSGAEYLQHATRPATQAMAAFAESTRGQTVTRPMRSVHVFDKGALPHKGATQADRNSHFKTVDEARAAEAAATATAAVEGAVDLVSDVVPPAVVRARADLAEALADDDHRARCVAQPETLERLGELVPRLPPFMERIIHDRTVRRPMLIRAVAAALLSQGRPWSPALQRNCMVVVDGHCMSYARARAEAGDAFLDDAAAAADGGGGARPSDADHVRVPLASFLDANGRHRVMFLYALENDVAEADMSMFWHVAAVRPARCIIHTVDTDLLPLSMLFDAAQRAPDTELYVALPKVRRGQPTRMLYYHANATVRALREFRPLTGGSMPVHCFVTLLLTPGSDYTRPFKGVPMKHFYAAFTALRLATLVRDGLVVDYDDYRALVGAAYHAANYRIIRDEAPSLQRVGDASYEVVRAALARRRAADWQLPGDAELRQRHAATQEILRIWSQVGTRHTVLPSSARLPAPPELPSGAAAAAASDTIAPASPPKRQRTDAP